MKTKIFTAVLLISSIVVGCATAYTKTSSGLQFTILKKAKGEKTKVGDEILLYETTSYRNGTILYSNEGSGSPIKVKIGAGQVTTAVDEGLLGMRVGEIKQLIAPPYLVRRTIYPKNVSPDSTLVIKMILHQIVTKENQ